MTSKEHDNPHMNDSKVPEQKICWKPSEATVIDIRRYD